MAYDCLIVERPEPAITLIRLNRPEALNALNGKMMDELTAVLDAGEGVRWIVGGRGAGDEQRRDDHDPSRGGMQAW
jgi:enoyl-CoA hydratase/carnithine racemase